MLTSEQIEELVELEWAATNWCPGFADNGAGKAKREAALFAAARNALPELLAMARELANEKNVSRLHHQSYVRQQELLYQEEQRHLATRRALKLAQAKGLGRVAYVWNQTSMPRRCVWSRAQRLRAISLCVHYAAKFEREAEEMGSITPRGACESQPKPSTHSTRFRFPR